MQPIIRLTDYIEEYKRLSYEYYPQAYNIVYVTYYQLDFGSTKYDPHYLETYHKTGNMSARKWNKIYSTPVTFAETVTSNMNADEHGVFRFRENEMNIVIDPIIGLEPHVGDYVLFDISGDIGSWVVSNVEYTGTLENPHYKCKLNQERLRSDAFREDAINSENVYIEYLKKIYEYETGLLYLNLLHRQVNVIKYLNKFYNHNLCAHVFDNKFFIELESIIYDYSPANVPIEMIGKEKYDVTHKAGSIITLLTLPQVYKGPLCSTFTDSKINPRTHYYRGYTELYNDDDGENEFFDMFYTNDTLNQTNVNIFEQNIENKTNDPLNLSTLLGELLDEYQRLLQGDLLTERLNSEYNNIIEACIDYCMTTNKLMLLSDRSVKL